MYIPPFNPLTVLQLFALCSSAYANLIIHRQSNGTALVPWVSVDPNGNAITTITPVFTTVNGVATTLNPAAATTLATSMLKGNQEASATGALPEPTASGSFEVCKNLEGDFAPFCLPNNSTKVLPGGTYYVTWDTGFFTTGNGSVFIQANYVNNSDGGPQAFQSQPILNSLGFLSWTIDKAWMKGKSSNNVTLYIVPIDPNLSEPTSFKGPTVMIANKDWFRQEPAKLPEGPALYIALPLVFAFILICLCGGCLINRKRRQIGLGSVMGRGKGYGVGKSRTQRLGLKKREKESDIMLRNQELTADGQYRDVQATSELDHAGFDFGNLGESPTPRRTEVR